ncbi:S-adenosyl-dependent methyltransferase activity on membrane-located substrates [Syntrophobacter sp. SbD1]|nr:S-adenosyl-dependent methyltransferase activity on membrane-located substrates [Syntrophobacter sp. SbD1]
MNESPGDSKHIPVMLGPVIELLDCKPGGIYVDGTVGGGGYARSILEKSAGDGVVLGMDWDGEALKRARERLDGYGERLILEMADFADIRRVLRKHGIGQVDGIVVDLGVSSFQIEDAQRGFSFSKEGPLDMRMNRDLPQTAADLVNALQERDLADLIYRYGEERLSRRIARAIAAARRKGRIDTTRELAELIRKTVPASRDASRIHPATRTFQALRIAVNREIDSLERFLPEALDVLKPGGRVCAVAFHSLEDRVVKEAFRNWARSCRCPRERAACECEGKPLVRLLTKKALRPSADELEGNPRARSARLRAVEKL